MHRLSERQKIMSDMDVQAALDHTAGLTQWQRVTDTFTAPSKTFDDIKGGNRSWWMPFLLITVVSYIFFAAITLKVGWPQVAENSIHENAKAEAKMAQAPEAQREQIIKFTQYAMEYGFAASPVLIVLFGVIATVVVWGTINFVFAGKSTFGQVFAVWMYASLPSILKSLLGTVVIFAGLAPESFHIENPAPTSVGAFVSPQDVGPALYKLATSLDVTLIWYLVLFSIGTATVAGVKRSSGYITVFGWWAIVALFGVAMAAIRG
jgi:hypothetical protein